MIEEKVNKTIDSIQNYGVEQSLSLIFDLYNYTMSNIKSLPNIKQKQTAGIAFAFLAYQKIPNLGRYANLAYYCLCKATSHCPTFLPFHLIKSYITLSRAERTKLLLKGALKLIGDRIYVIRDIPHQDAYDLCVLGDIIILKKDGYESEELWWKNALEDEIKIRTMYSQYSEREVVEISEKVHNVICDKIYEDLVTYAYDFGFIRS